MLYRRFLHFEFTPKFTPFGCRVIKSYNDLREVTKKELWNLYSYKDL